MAPTPVLERHDPLGAVTADARAAAEAYTGRCRQMASVAGVLNAAHGALVDITIHVLAEGDHVGPGLHSPGQFLAWRLGCSKETANQLVAIARRAGELPVLLAALRAGEISLEQAVVVARNVPASYDESATALAKEATVDQLRSVLPSYRYEEETAEQQAARERRTAARRERSGGLFHDEDGGARLTVHLDAAQAAALEAAITAARDDLYDQRRADATSAASETGGEAAAVDVPTLAETTAALAATALASGHLAHPGSERFTITYHLGAGPDGSPCLTDEHGRVVPASERRRLLCDHRFDAIVHQDNGTALSVGRATRHIGRKLRRVVLHRHRGRCAVPGCDAARHLEVHHIIHWEDGGPTDTANLLPLCHRHHHAHHDGLLDIAGNADLPPGTPGCVTISVHGRALDTSGSPLRVPPGQSVHDAHHDRTGQLPGPASTPNGERLHRHTLHLRRAEPPAAADVADDVEAEPPPAAEPAPARRHHPTPATGRGAPCARPEAHGPPEAR